MSRKFVELRSKNPTLQDRIGSDCTDCDTWQQRGEEEEIARADHCDIIIGGIKFLEKCSRRPAAADDDNILLRGVVGQLRTWIPLPLGDIVEDTAGCHDGEKGDSSERLQAATPCGQLRVGSRRGLYDRGRQLEKNTIIGHESARSSLGWWEWKAVYERSIHVVSTGHEEPRTEPGPCEKRR